MCVGKVAGWEEQVKRSKGVFGREKVTGVVTFHGQEFGGETHTICMVRKGEDGRV